MRSVFSKVAIVLVIGVASADARSESIAAPKETWKETAVLGGHKD